MADIADKSSEDSELLDKAAIDHIRELAANMPIGEAGECNGCGEYFARTVQGLCGRCRDRQLRALR